MESRGYTKADNADLVLNFKGKLEEKTDIESTPAPMYGAGWGYRGYYGAPYGGYGGTEVSTRRYNVGTLVMDVVDREKQQVVFQGGVEDVVTKKMLEDREALLTGAVSQIFAKYPFVAGQSAPVACRRNNSGQGTRRRSEGTLHLREMESAPFPVSASALRSSGRHGHTAPMSSASHSDHDHDHATGARLRWALVLTSVFMVLEVAAGFWSGSLALLADAGHMLTDSAALGLALFAVVVSRRPPDARRTYGYGRMRVLAAFINGLALLVIAAWIVIEAVRRLDSPVEILAGPMLAVAFAGFVVNVIVYLTLRGGTDLNTRGAMAHVLGDLLGSVAAIAAAAIILATGWTRADPLLSIVVAALIVRTGWHVTRESGHALLEGSPPTSTPEKSSVRARSDPRASGRAPRPCLDRGSG